MSSSDVALYSSYSEPMSSCTTTETWEYLYSLTLNIYLGQLQITDKLSASLNNPNTLTLPLINKPDPNTSGIVMGALFKVGECTRGSMGC